MGKVLPTRFSAYIFLLLGIIVSLWLADDSIRKSVRIAGACAVVLFMLPNLSSSYWATQVDIPAFFSNGLYTRYLSPGENVLILPYSFRGNSDIWQAVSGFYFRMAGGYLGPPLVPLQFQRYLPLVHDFYYQADLPLSAELLKAFLAQNQVGAIVVADQQPHLWIPSAGSGPAFPQLVDFNKEERDGIRSLFGTLGVAPIQIGGVSLYRVPLDKLERYKDTDLTELGQRIAMAQMDTLTIAANNYLSSGRPASELNLFAAQRLGLLPPHWVVLDANGGTQNYLLLTVMDNGNVLVGVIGSREVIQGLRDKYRPNSKQIEIMPLAPVATFAEHMGWILIVEYDRFELASAAALARDHMTLGVTDK
jgi:hypothetical protein